MTQEEFAHAVGVTVSTVNRWENSHREPNRLASKAIQDLAASRGLGDLAGAAAAHPD
jgi:DNA-binding transcriptional regulator YiaG